MAMPFKRDPRGKMNCKVAHLLDCEVDLNNSIVQHFPLSLNWVFLSLAYVWRYPKASPPGQEVELQIEG